MPIHAGILSTCAAEVNASRKGLGNLRTALNCWPSPSILTTITAFGMMIPLLTTVNGLDDRCQIRTAGISDAMCVT